MTIFVIIPRTAGAISDSVVSTAFQNESYKLDNGDWLVSSSGTAIDVAKKIGVTETGGPSVIVFVCGSYWGRAPAPVWDWIKAKLEAKTNG